MQKAVQVTRRVGVVLADLEHVEVCTSAWAGNEEGAVN